MYGGCRWPKQPTRPPPTRPPRASGDARPGWILALGLWAIRPSLPGRARLGHEARRPFRQIPAARLNLAGRRTLGSSASPLLPPSQRTRARLPNSPAVLIAQFASGPGALNPPGRASPVACPFRYRLTSREPVGRVRRSVLPSSRGLGHGPLKAETRVRVPLGAPSVLRLAPITSAIH